MKKSIIRVLFIIFLSLRMFAGTTGKIAGYAKDANSGKVLPGLNVIISGTGQGAPTDEEGYFFINNIHPGTYSLVASYIGYKKLQMKNVHVSVNHTTNIEINMTESVVRMDDAVIVVADRPMIKIDETSKKTVIGGDQLTDKLPITNVTEVLALQSGIVKDASGDLHIRGGRSGEIAYLIDGVYVRNPFDNSLGGNVAVNAIQEMEVVSGTFNAEYGSALSGIVNVVTKEGSPEFKFRFQYESAMLNSSPYHTADWLLDTDEVEGLSDEDKIAFNDQVLDSLGNSAYQKFNVTEHHLTSDLAIINFLGTMNGSISGPIPFLKDKASFFLAGTFRNENSQLPFGFDLERVLSGKFTYKLLPSVKLQLSMDLSKNYDQNYYHRYKYWSFFESSDPQVGSYPITEDIKNRTTLRLSHTLSNATFYNLSFSRIYNYEEDLVPERTIVTDPETGSLVSSDYISRDFYEGLSSNWMLGDVRYWRETESTTYDVDFDLLSQVNKYNQIKTGIEYRQHELFRHRIGHAPREQLQFFTRKPIEFAAFIQDKIELSFLIANVGLRFDYFDAKDTYFSEPGLMMETITNDAGVSELVTVPEEDTPIKYSISPRIGLAHPISATTMFHFAYGQFFQIPRFYDLYRDNDIRAVSQNDPLIGNPGLEVEETTAFEAGIKQQLGADYALDVTAYYKDIDNLISSLYYFGARDYTVFVNADFGRVQGLDFTLSKQYSHYFSGALNYSFMIAEGNESDPYEGFSQYREDDAHLRPNRTFPLDYDQRHAFSVNCDVSLPKKFGVFGNLSANVLFRAASGLPYTPSSRDPDATVVPEPNSGRMPWTQQMDLRVVKRVKITDMNLDMYVRVENVFDKINVTDVWPRSGLAWSQGPYSNFSKDRQANPENIGTRRLIRAGLVIRL